jgi:excisionase family DNA binding protein
MFSMAPKIDPDRYMTVGNAAKLANVSRHWLRRLIQGGHLAGIAMDGQWFALRSAVEAYAKTTPPTGRPRGGKHSN